MPAESVAPETAAPVTSPNRLQMTVRLAAAVLFTVLVSAAAIAFRHELQGLQDLGYPGIFIMSLLANATVILPAPGLAFTFAMGSVLNPLLVGLAAGAGETIGEFSGYIAGRTGRSAFGQDPRYARLEDSTRKYGGWAILVLSFVPVGVFDVVGIAAGAMRMPLSRFVPAMWVGKTAKTILFAYAGSRSLTWLLELLR